jgi:catechol 2,3-dioxygenase-like lactoylglutathione lyase family enzyme
MSHARRFDHVGITVADLDAVTAFFVGLGLEVENRMFVEGEFLDTVIGIPGSRTEIVMLQPPDGGTRLELSSFARPDHLPGSPAAPANELGLRNVAFEVHDLQAAVDRAATDGYRLVGGIGEYEGSWRMAYVRGPEGLSSRWPSASAEPRKPDRGAPSTADLRRASHRESASHEVAFGKALRRLDTYAGLTPKSPAHAADRVERHGARREVLAMPTEPAGSRELIQPRTEANWEARHGKQPESSPEAPAHRFPA